MNTLSTSTQKKKKKTYEHEDRRHWRQRAYRLKSREEPSSTGPRGGGRITLHRRQHHHRRGTGRSACRRAGSRRCRKRTLVGGPGRSGILREVGTQPPC